MLDAYRNYFRALRESYLRAETSSAPELDRTRLEGRLARSNLEASIDRSSVEPGVSARSVSVVNGMLASSHRLAHAMMAPSRFSRIRRLADGTLRPGQHRGCYAR